MFVIIFFWSSKHLCSLKMSTTLTVTDEEALESFEIYMTRFWRKNWSRNFVQTKLKKLTTGKSGSILHIQIDSKNRHKRAVVT